MHALMVHRPPPRAVRLLLPPQHRPQPPIAEWHSLRRQLAQMSSQLRIVRLPPPVTPTPSVHPHQPTGVPLAQPGLFSRHTHRLSLLLRAYHFFDSTTFSASMSN